MELFLNILITSIVKFYNKKNNLELKKILLSNTLVISQSKFRLP
ncbi:hypothetical protein HMPREF1883_00456, partial [Streptococcus agalactiae]